ncbi:PQQ-binding-like beta-propeller repeat protein [Streptomyces sp. NPDC005728]|uniref:outer membrane protein assembly factor BamB family protein n=1 Tax=Streptomyces sp. NPDC005728 TaxID=3157054 RepID=UPI0033CA14AB
MAQEAALRFDAATGERRWQQSVSNSAMGLDVHRPSGLLITGEDGLVIGIDPRTGHQRWAIDVFSLYDATWILAGDLILCSRGTAVLGKTGKKLWTRSDFQPQGDLAQPLGEGLLDGNAKGLQRRTSGGGFRCASTATSAQRARLIRRPAGGEGSRWPCGGSVRDRDVAVIPLRWTSRPNGG